jgi:hypothetical protein
LGRQSEPEAPPWSFSPGVPVKAAVVESQVREFFATDGGSMVAVFTGLKTAR